MLLLVPALVRYGHGGESVTHEAQLQLFFIFMLVCHLTHTLHGTMK